MRRPPGAFGSKRTEEVKVRCAAGLSVDPGDDSVAMDRPEKVHSARWVERAL
jgi:hypothetical protein